MPVSRRTAEMTPSGIATIVAINTERIASSAVIGRAFQSNSATGFPERRELPGSPCNSPHIHFAYWTGIGSDSPIALRIRKAMGLSDPIPVQYAKWMWGLLHGDPGNSLRSGKPVAELLWKALPITAELAILSVLMATIVAIPLGVISAVRRDTGMDYSSRVFGLIGLSLPNFWIATLLLLFTSKMFGWVPSIRYVPFVE